MSGYAKWNRSTAAPGRRFALADPSAVVISSPPVRCLLEMEDGSFIECAVMKMRGKQSQQSATMQVGLDGRLYAPALPPDLKIELEVIAIRSIASVSVPPVNPEEMSATLKDAKRVQEANDAGMRRFAELELEDKKK